MNDEQDIEPISYDPAVIYQYAAKLYDNAKQTIAGYGISAAVAGAFIGKVCFESDLEFAAEIFLAIVLGAIGASIGKEKAFQYKLQAQTALCHVKIEENTRAATEQKKQGNRFSEDLAVEPVSPLTARRKF